MNTPGEIEAIRSIVERHTPKKNDGLAEVEFRSRLNTVHIPKASALLSKVHDAAEAALERGEFIAAKMLCELYFKTCGLVKPANREAEIQMFAKTMIEGMIAEARARREEPK